MYCCQIVRICIGYSHHFIKYSLFNCCKFVAETLTIKLELFSDVQMQVLIDELGGKDPDFRKKLIRM